MIRIARHALQRFELPLLHPLATAHGRIAARRGVIVQLVDDGGRVGAGEAAPLPGFAQETLAEAEQALARVADALGARDAPATLDDALDRVEALTEKEPCARAALDSALHDLEAQREGLSLAAWLARAEGRTPRQHVAIAALLRGQSAAEVGAEAERAVRAGHRALKLKVGAGGDDLARVAAARAACPEAVELRLDANAAWSESEAADALVRLALFHPTWIEQPVASLEALVRLRAASRIPLAVDEGLASAADAARLAETRAADVWVVKPAVVGGLRAARRVAALGRAAGAAVVVSGFLDTAVGSAAALALAAALPDAHPAGLDPVLARDLARLPPVLGGERALPPGPGLGVRT